MSTLTREERQLGIPAHEKTVAKRPLWAGVGQVLLRLLGGLIILLSLIPVILLPFVTAVSLELALADAALFVFLLTWAETLALRATKVVALVGTALLAVPLSQRFAATPSIVGVDDQPLPGSIAEMQRAELNGVVAA